MFKELQKRLIKYSDVVYYSPMTEEEVSQFEQKVGKKINLVFREFLLTFGFTQDVLRDFEVDERSILEDAEYLKDKLPDYFPISIEVDEFDTIYLMSNSNRTDKIVYKVRDNAGEFGEITKYDTFTNILEKSIQMIEDNPGDRCPNSEKINNYEYMFTSKYYDDFIEILNVVGLKQKTDWRAKYYPENVFGDEIAIFELLGEEVLLERNEDKTEYRLEFDEPILFAKENSISMKIDNLLKAKRIEYEKDEFKLIETE